jgi:hypothetical protein
MDPTAVFFYDDSVAQNRKLWLGGGDGVIRSFDPARADDDGAAISSRVKFTPVRADGVQYNTRINRIATVLDADSDPVSVRLYAAESPEEAVKLTTPVWSYKASPVDRYSIPRISGNTLVLEIKNDAFSALWTTGTVYAVGDQVTASDEKPYTSLTAHTSTTGGAHDTPPGNTTDWVLSSFYSWATESVSLTIDQTGRTRHRRI